LPRHETCPGLPHRSHKHTGPNWPKVYRITTTKILGAIENFNSSPSFKRLQDLLFNCQSSCSAVAEVLPGLHPSSAWQKMPGDVWSMGCVMFKMFTNRLPFEVRVNACFLDLKMSATSWGQQHQGLSPGVVQGRRCCKAAGRAPTRTPNTHIRCW